MKTSSLLSVIFVIIFNVEKLWAVLYLLTKSYDFVTSF